MSPTPYSPLPRHRTRRGGGLMQCVDAQPHPFGQQPMTSPGQSRSRARTCRLPAAALCAACRRPARLRPACRCSCLWVAYLQVPCLRAACPRCAASAECNASKHNPSRPGSTPRPPRNRSKNPGRQILDRSARDVVCGGCCPTMSGPSCVVAQLISPSADTTSASRTANPFIGSPYRSRSRHPRRQSRTRQPSSRTVSVTADSRQSRKGMAPARVPPARFCGDPETQSARSTRYEAFLIVSRQSICVLRSTHRIKKGVMPASDPPGLTPPTATARQARA